MSPRAGVLTCKIYSDLRASEFRLEFNLTAAVDAVQHNDTYETAKRCFSQDIRNNFSFKIFDSSSCYWNVNEASVVPTNFRLEK